ATPHNQPQTGDCPDGIMTREAFGARELAPAFARGMPHRPPRPSPKPIPGFFRPLQTLCLFIIVPSNQLNILNHHITCPRFFIHPPLTNGRQQPQPREGVITYNHLGLPQSAAQEIATDDSNARSRSSNVG